MGFIVILQVILLGIIEGITEWLPISSTGHMLLFDSFWPLKNVTEDFKSMFFVVIQLGAILAVVVLFWKKLFPFRFKEKPVVQKDIFSLWGKVLVACLPAAIIGIPLDDVLEKYLHPPLVISLMLIIYGIAFILVENRNKKREFRIQTTHEIDYKTAIIIGAFQVLSLIPGTSRSGATILGAMLIGCSRPAAAEFSFFLGIPVMFGASFLKIVKFFIQGGGFSFAEFIYLVLGMVVAFGVSVYSIKFLMGYVRKHDFKFFGYYRIVLGIVVLSYFGISALVG